MQNRVRLSNRNQLARELQEIAAFGSDPLPVEPRHRVVLRVGVVVAVLGMAELVAGQAASACPAREAAVASEIALLPRAQLLDHRIVGGPLHAVVPRMIVGVAVAIFLAIRFVVLVVVRYEIIRG